MPPFCTQQYSHPAAPHSALKPVTKADCLSRDTLGSCSTGSSMKARPPLLPACTGTSRKKKCIFTRRSSKPCGGQNLSICRAPYPNSTRCRIQPRRPSTIQHREVPEGPTAYAALGLCSHSCHSLTGRPRALFQVGGVGGPAYCSQEHVHRVPTTLSHMCICLHTLPCAHTEYTRAEHTRIHVHTAGLHTHLRAGSHACTHTWPTHRGTHTV